MIIKRLLKHKRLDFFVVDCVSKLITFICFVCTKITFLKDKQFFYEELEDRYNPARIITNFGSIISGCIFVVMFVANLNVYGIWASLIYMIVHIAIVEGMKITIIKMVKFFSEYNEFNESNEEGD